MSGAEHELAEMLQRGIAAAKAGDNEMARNLLTRVVEQDERNITAWLWLAGVALTTEDRQVCLENVLAIDPHHSAARAALDKLLGQTTEAPQRKLSPRMSEQYTTTGAPSLASAILQGTPEEASAEAETEPFVPVQPAGPMVEPEQPPSSEGLEAQLAEFDNEYLCPYCATLTQPEDAACPACGVQLWLPVRRREKRSRLLWLTIFLLAVGVGWSLFGFLVWGFLNIQDLFTAHHVTLEQFTGLYLGFDTLPKDAAAAFFKQLPQMAFWTYIFGVAINVLLIALLYWRWPPVYWGGVVLTGVNLVFAAIAMLTNLTPGSIVGAILALLVFGLFAALHDDFAMGRKRILCELDKNIRTHTDFYLHGREYARQKKWTQAVIHFQRAVGSAPDRLPYHLALATAYAKVKHYARARSALAEAQRIAPDNPDVLKLVNVIAEKE